MLYCYFYIKNENTYKDLIIKLQKYENDKKILNNSDDSANILNIYNFLYNFMNILYLFKFKNDEFKLKIMNNNYKKYIIFINKEISEDIIKYLVNKNSEDYYHNNIVFILIKYYYILYDIKTIYNILEEDENDEFTYINIILPIINIIDKTFLKSLLNVEQNENYIIDNFYDLLKLQDNKLTDDDKINIILKKNIITPILDDFVDIIKIQKFMINLMINKNLIK